MRNILENGMDRQRSRMISTEDGTSLNLIVDDVWHLYTATFFLYEVGYTVCGKMLMEVKGESKDTIQRVV